MSYTAESSTSSSLSREQFAPRMAVALACALAPGTLAAPAMGQGAHYPSVYVEEVALHTGARATGQARIVEPRGFGSTATAPHRIVLEVGPGPLQRAFEQAHRDGEALTLAGRILESGQGNPNCHVRYELERVRVTSYRLAGIARVVLEPAGDGAASGDRTHEPIVFRKRIDRAAPDGAPCDGRRAVEFVLEVDGRTFARFAEASGLEAAPGGAAVGRASSANVTLKRGTTEGADLRPWTVTHETASGRHASAGAGDGAGARKSASIVMYDATGRAVGRWRLTNAWPKKLELGSSRVDGSQAIESVTLVYETIQRVAP